MKRFLPILAIILTLGCEQEDPEVRAARSADAREKAEAMVQCQQAIAKELRTPSSAKFSGVLQTGIVCEFSKSEIEEKRSCGVSGWVDAQNGFGGVIRNEYVCIARHTDHNWTSIEFGWK